MAVGGGLEQWWKEIPLLTRWGFGAAFFFTLSANIGPLISPIYLTLDWDRIVRGFEIWRIITCFPFMGRLGLPFLMNMVLFYRYSSFVEDTTFKGRTADYLWMWICGALLLLAFGLYWRMPVLGMGLIMMVIYYWSRKNPDGIVTFMFGLKFQSIYLPWVMLAFTILLGGIPIMEFVGIIIGHVYWFLENIAPQVYNVRLIRTPQFLYDLFPRQYNQMAPGAQNRPAGHQWGQGNALGARR